MREREVYNRCRRARRKPEQRVKYYAHRAVRAEGKPEPDTAKWQLLSMRLGLGGLMVLQLTAEAERLTRVLLATGTLPDRAQTDAAHLAIAAAAKADYLLTWKCRHLANAQILRRLEVEAKRAGGKLPKVCTPPELRGDSA